MAKIQIQYLEYVNSVGSWIGVAQVNGQRYNFDIVEGRISATPMIGDDCTAKTDLKLWRQLKASGQMQKTEQKIMDKAFTFAMENKLGSKGFIG